jgi:hypothetical protein
MTATRIKFFDFVPQLRCAVPDVHPAGRATIDEWLAEMSDVAARDDAETVAKLARWIKEKIELEHGVDDDDEPDV